MKISLDSKRSAAVDFIGSVRRDLKASIVMSGRTVADVADAIGISPNQLRKELGGSHDITAGRIAEICWAIGGEAKLMVSGKIKEGR